MRATARAVVALLTAAALSGCIHTTGSIPAEHDFLGRIVQADVSTWQTSSADVNTGHAQFDYRVGPGTITLDDGTELVVPPDTPGGNHCVHLAEDRWDAGNSNLCFAIGSYVDEGPEVAWFGLVGEAPDLPPGHIRVPVTDIDDRTRQAVVDEVGRLLRFDLADEIALSGCDGTPDTATELASLPPAAAHSGLLDASTGTVYGIECLYQG